MITVSVICPWSSGEKGELETRHMVEVRFEDKEILGELISKHIPTLPGILEVQTINDDKLVIETTNFASYAVVTKRVLMVASPVGTRQLTMVS